MNKAFITDVQESSLELLYCERKEKDNYRRDKFKMLYLIRTEQSKSIQQLSNLLGRNRNTISKWLKLYHLGGIDTLLKTKVSKGGRPPKIHFYGLEKLEAKLRTPEGFKSYKDIAIWLQKNYLITIQPKRLYYYLKKLKAKPKVVRPKNVGQNKELFENFKNYFPELINSFLQDEAILQKYPRVQIWFEDESTFSDEVIKRRKITIKGVKPVGLMRKKNNSFYIYGSFSPQTGNQFCQIREKVNTKEFDQYLVDFSKEYIDTYNLMILDRAPFHTTKELITPKNVKLIFLPALSPELNPSERVWEGVKNRLSWEILNLKETETRVCEELANLDSNKLIKLTNYPYIRETMFNLNQESNSNFSQYRKTKLAFRISSNIQSKLQILPNQISTGRPKKLSPVQTLELSKDYRSKEYTIAELKQKYGISKSGIFKLVK